MPRATSSRRFAQAIFQLAIDAGQIDSWIDDLTIIANALENQMFSEFLDAPQVSVEHKVEIIRKALGSSVNPMPINLISLLASRNITNIIPDIVIHYQLLIDVYKGVERAEIVSAVPLGDAEHKSVIDLLQIIVGKEVRLEARVEPQILGGFIARVGDHLIDGSTKTKLDQMRRQIVHRL